MTDAEEDHGEVETDAERRKAWWFYLAYGAIAVAAAVGAYLTTGVVRIVLIVLAAFFAAITIWSVLFMAVIEFVVYVAKKGLDQYRRS